MLLYIGAITDKTCELNTAFEYRYPLPFKGRISVGISVGIKMILGKTNDLSIVILWFDYLTPYKVIVSPSKKRLSNITSSLL